MKKSFSLLLMTVAATFLLNEVAGKGAQQLFVKCMYPGALRCPNGVGCIIEQERCDGILQCTDGSDEDNCLSFYAKNGIAAPVVMKPQPVVTVQKQHAAPVVVKSHPAPVVVKSHPAPQAVMVPAPKQAAVVLQQVVNLFCQTGYVMGEDSLCYRFSTGLVKYAAAEKACAEEGAGLAVLRDEVSHGYVYGFLQVYNPHAPYWIGLEDRAIEGQFLYADGEPLGKFNRWDTEQPDDMDRDCAQMEGEGQFLYADGEPLGKFNRWDTEQPDDLDRDQDCVQMQGFYWHDESCCEEKNYICQAPAQQITCFCHNHSTTCTMDGGCADCQHNTMGANCELCQPGFAGMATQGTPNDCLPIQTYKVMSVKQPVYVMRPKK